MNQESCCFPQLEDFGKSGLSWAGWGLKSRIFSRSPDAHVMEITLTFVLYCIVQPQQGPSFAYVSNWGVFSWCGRGRHGVYLDMHAPVPAQTVADGELGRSPNLPKRTEIPSCEIVPVPPGGVGVVGASPPAGLHPGNPQGCPLAWNGFFPSSERMSPYPSHQGVCREY